MTAPQPAPTVQPQSDAMVFFGGTGDLARKKIYPALLVYVEGDYNDAHTFVALRAALGAAKYPLHYLAIPPDMFTTVATGLGVRRTEHLSHRSLLGQGSGAEPARLPLCQHVSRADLEQSVH